MDRQIELAGFYEAGPLRLPIVIDRRLPSGHVTIRRVEMLRCRPDDALALLRVMGAGHAPYGLPVEEELSS